MMHREEETHQRTPTEINHAATFPTEITLSIPLFFSLLYHLYFIHDVVLKAENTAVSTSALKV